MIVRKKKNKKIITQLDLRIDPTKATFASGLSKLRAHKLGS